MYKPRALSTLPFRVTAVQYAGHISSRPGVTWEGGKRRSQTMYVIQFIHLYCQYTGLIVLTLGTQPWRVASRGPRYDSWLAPTHANLVTKRR